MIILQLIIITGRLQGNTTQGAEKENFNVKGVTLMLICLYCHIAEKSRLV